MGSITDRDSTSGKKGFSRNIATTDFLLLNLLTEKKINYRKDDIHKLHPSVLTGGPFLLDERGRVHGGLERWSASGKEYLQKNRR
jgi:hypothetical protein